MQNTLTLLVSHAVNGVISTRQLKSSNLRLHRLLRSNFETLSKQLLDEHDIRILDDLLPVLEPAHIKLYLKYYYDAEINLTDLRASHRPVYRVIEALGPPREVIHQWGLVVTYDSISTETMLYSKLREIADKNGRVKLPRPLYNKATYRAKQHGKSLEEYLISLGFTLNAVADSEIVRLHDSQKMSFQAIADRLGISKSTAQRRYNHAKKDLILPS